MENTIDILKEDIEYLIVYDTKNNKQLAIITQTDTDTASENIVIKIKYKKD